MNMRKINPIRWTISSPVRYRSFKLVRLHAYLIALPLRAAMALGFVVVVIGRCRSGKSLILNRITPNKVICKEREAISGLPRITASELPSGKFSIDEISVFDPNTFNTPILNLKNRIFALSVQEESTLERLGLEHLIANRRRLLVILKR